MIPVVRQNRAITRAFAALDEVSLEEIFLETSSIPQWCLSGGRATFNAGGFVGDDVRVVQSACMETLHVAAQNPPLQIGKGRIDPQEQTPRTFHQMCGWAVDRPLTAGARSCQSPQSRCSSATSKTVRGEEGRASTGIGRVGRTLFSKAGSGGATCLWGQRHRCGGHFQERCVKSSRAANR